MVCAIPNSLINPHSPFHVVYFIFMLESLLIERNLYLLK